MPRQNANRPTRNLGPSSGSVQAGSMPKLSLALLGELGNLGPDSDGRLVELARRYDLLCARYLADSAAADERGESDFDDEDFHEARYSIMDEMAVIPALGVAGLVAKFRAACPPNSEKELDYSDPSQPIVWSIMDDLARLWPMIASRAIAPV